MKEFNAKFDQVIKTIPALTTLQTENTKTKLKNLLSISNGGNNPFNLALLGTANGGHPKIQKEMTAFLSFINAQSTGTPINTNSKEAIDFAYRWTDAIRDEKKMRNLSKENLDVIETITQAALALVKFDKT